MDRDTELTIASISCGALGAILAWLGKRPVARQLVRNSEFETQIRGFKVLVDELQSSNEYLRKQESLRDEYEAELIRRIRQLEREARGQLATCGSAR